MLKWTEEKPTKPGWYVWFREEYDQLRTEFFFVNSPEDDDRPDSLRAYSNSAPDGRHLNDIVGGGWYGPIPRPPLAELAA